MSLSRVPHGTIFLDAKCKKYTNWVSRWDKFVRMNYESFPLQQLKKAVTINNIYVYVNICIEYK